MRLKILAEGSTKRQRLIKHWGLSVLIDDDILFDTFGKPDYVVKQLKRFSIDLNKIKHIVISHDDWDHISGLWKILERNQDVTVYICPHFPPEIKKRIKWYGARIVEAEASTKILGDIYSSGELTGSRGGVDVPEQYLAIKTSNGLVVLTGCAHPGIIEIVQHAKVTFNSEVRLIIGGFHLKDRTAEEARDIVLKLKELGVRRIIPFHCTGRIAQDLFTGEYKSDCVIPVEGQTIEI